MKKEYSAALVICLCLGVFSMLLWYKPLQNRLSTEEPILCAQDAKLCSDGTYVSRSGPSCVFTACPEIASWQTSTDVSTGISFKYPEQLSTTYIHTTDWPPQIDVSTAEFTCAEAGKETMQGGRTERKMINGHDYCSTVLSEGAAGSTYTQYTYATKKGDKTVIATFGVRSVQCGNYDDPQKSACETERTMFSIDSIADEIMGTVTFK